jgi:Icc-related predicted phosphoesterase
MKLCWLTDIHLNFLSEEKKNKFYKKICETHCDAILISGDIAEASSINILLKEMARDINKPIYFVLGNHDYYHGWVDKVRNEMIELCQQEPLLNWLSENDCVELQNDTVLIGQDGWADGQYGDYQNSNVTLNDSRLISDLFNQAILGKNKLLNKMQELANQDAKQLENNLLKSTNNKTKKIIILTHVPPFEGACWHEGKTSYPDWLPFFTSKVMGEVILSIAKDNPAIDFLVLCGHTHSSGTYQPLPNLLVKTGKAEYYKSEIQEIIEV